MSFLSFQARGGSKRDAKSLAMRSFEICGVGAISKLFLTLDMAKISLEISLCKTIQRRLQEKHCSSHILSLHDQERLRCNGGAQGSFQERLIMTILPLVRTPGTFRVLRFPSPPQHLVEGLLELKELENFTFQFSEAMPAIHSELLFYFVFPI